MENKQQFVVWSHTQFCINTKYYYLHVVNVWSPRRLSCVIFSSVNTFQTVLPVRPRYGLRRDSVRKQTPLYQHVDCKPT